MGKAFEGGLARYLSTWQYTLPAGAENLSFLDVFSLLEIQRLQDAFARSTGVASLITDTAGRPLTSPSNFCRLCREVIRSTEVGERNCMLSDAALGRPNKAGPTISHCLSGGLYDAGVSIYFGERHVANWLIGQIIIDDEQAGKIREYAKVIGADQDEFDRALAAVPRMSPERFADICRFLYITASYLSRSSLLNVVQQAEIKERQRVEQELILEKMNLAKVHREMSQAYENTIEGWALALEMRDIESAGHSRRVADMTVAIARRMGIGQEKLTELRRGAVLHDIGKMSIPDSILLKPGPLDEGEWRIMKLHPEYAKKLLLPISFLHSSLEIPLYHHERWDGTGYPSGLKGTDIPLAARIFAVVDVYDALSSDRPYRKAWRQDKIIEHILSEAGSHFDPEVVENFIAVIRQGPGKE